MESKTETDKKKLLGSKEKWVEEGWRNFQLISCTKIHFKFKPKTEMKRENRARSGSCCVQLAVPCRACLEKVS